MAKILIIGNSTFSKYMMRVILESEGHEVIDTADDIVGLERYSLDKPVLVMIDMTRERIQDGLEIIKTPQKIHPEARVVVVTEDDQESIRTQIKAAGARGLIHKPLKREEVLKAIKEALLLLTSNIRPFWPPRSEDK